MKIKSNFTDYYDYISNQYGGGDPSTVYIRHSVEPKSIHCGRHYPSQPLEHLLRSLSDIYLGSKRVIFGYLVCVGKLYVLHRVADDLTQFIRDPGNNGKSPDNGTWKILSREVLDEYVDVGNQERRSPFSSEASLKSFYLKAHGNEHPELIQLSKELKAPVFIVTSNFSNIEVHQYVPSLASLGMQAIIPPQDMYRDIEFFMNNVLRDSPDLNPPVQIADKDRVVQHGFDLKQSFRHRK